MVCHVLRGLSLKSLKPTFLFAQARSHSCRTSWWPLLSRTNLWQMCQKFCRHHCIAWQIRVGCTSWEVCFHTHPSPHDSILGFVLNSVTMTLQLTRGKAAGLQRVCTELLACPSPSIREVASVIGKIVSSFPGGMHGVLYYRHLEKDKSQALQRTKGNFNASMSLSSPAKSELQWWINNFATA